MPVFYTTESAFHYEIEQGNVFHWSHSWDDVAVGASRNMRIYTGSRAAREKHFVMTIAAVGVCKVELFESTRGVSGGTAVPAINLNRTIQVSPAIVTTVRRGVTVAGSKGTRLECMVMPGASILGLGGTTAEGPVWHLRNNETYLVEIHNMSAATSDICMVIERIVETAHTHAGD